MQLGEYSDPGWRLGVDVWAWTPPVGWVRIYAHSRDCTEGLALSYAGCADEYESPAELLIKLTRAAAPPRMMVRIIAQQPDGQWIVLHEFSNWPGGPYGCRPNPHG